MQACHDILKLTGVMGLCMITDYPFRSASYFSVIRIRLKIIPNRVEERAILARDISVLENPTLEPIQLCVEMTELRLPALLVALQHLARASSTALDDLAQELAGNASTAQRHMNAAAGNRID